ncbi:ImmA/IrrE family metallo-endopeptidase [Dactylosporangium sp. NPDC005572]|uniref:ImmA/IrrE family metallo-endopeptidase n=1 Tax=Dactylosporangium sp. NPDC005572 TaxID=3156889 RepID=UPI0033A46258
MTEVQAGVLLKMVGVVRPPVPVPILAEFLDIACEHDEALGVLGHHAPDGDSWRIGYGDPTPLARNATVAHQLKLILDAEFDEGELYLPVAVMAPRLRKHHAAEYFAQCLTMQSQMVQQAWCRGQEIDVLAEEFDVTPEAMLFRLKTLKLVESAYER